MLKDPDDLWNGSVDEKACGRVRGEFPRELSSPDGTDVAQDKHHLSFRQGSDVVRCKQTFSFDVADHLPI